METDTDTTTNEMYSIDADESPGISGLVNETIERLHDGAHVDRVYGKPFAADGKTVVPVARVAYGFAGGFGSGTDDEGETGEGGGGAGGVRATPVGVLEITPEGIRFVRFSKSTGRRLAGLALAVGAGYVLGRLLER